MGWSPRARDSSLRGLCLEQVVGRHPVGEAAAEVVALVEPGGDGRGGEQAAGPAGDRPVLVAVDERADRRSGEAGGGDGVEHGGLLHWGWPSWAERRARRGGVVAATRSGFAEGEAAGPDGG